MITTSDNVVAAEVDNIEKVVKLIDSTEDISVKKILKDYLYLMCNGKVFFTDRSRFPGEIMEIKK